MYSRASRNKNLVNELQNKLEEEIETKNKNFFKNYLIAVIVLLSWVMVLVWSYFKIKILYYYVCNNLFRK
jgi:Na+/H+ antiporter NhaC